MSMHLLLSQQGASKPDAETLHRSCCWKNLFGLEGATHGEDSRQDLAGWEVEVKVFHREMHVTRMYVYAVSLLDAEATLVSVTAKEVCVQYVVDQQICLSQPRGFTCHKIRNRLEKKSRQRYCLDVKGGQKLGIVSLALVCSCA